MVFFFVFIFENLNTKHCFRRSVDSFETRQQSSCIVEQFFYYSTFNQLQIESQMHIEIVVCIFCHSVTLKYWLF